MTHNTRTMDGRKTTGDKTGSLLEGAHDGVHGLERETRLHGDLNGGETGIGKGPDPFQNLGFDRCGTTYLHRLWLKRNVPPRSVTAGAAGGPLLGRHPLVLAVKTLDGPAVLVPYDGSALGATAGKSVHLTGDPDVPATVARVYGSERGTITHSTSVHYSAHCINPISHSIVFKGCFKLIQQPDW